MLILSIILVYLVVDLLLRLGRQEAVHAMAGLAVMWAVIASWITVSALRGDLTTTSWTATHAHSVAMAYLPLIFLGTGLAIGDVLSGWEENPSGSYIVARENRSTLTVALYVLPLLAVFGTAIAFGISVGLIQPVNGLPASVTHAFAINSNLTNLEPGWPSFQYDVRMGFIHTVFSAFAIIMSLVSLIGGVIYGLIVGRLNLRL